MRSLLLCCRATALTVLMAFAPAAWATPEVIALTLPSGKALQVEVMVKDAMGKPVTKADVSLLFVMPAMPAMKMAEMKNTVKLMAMKDGMYAGQGNVMMAGTWNVTIDVMQNGKSLGQKKVTVTAK